MKETYTAAAERERENCAWTEDGLDGGHYFTEAQEVPWAEGAGTVKDETPIKERLSELCLFSVGTALHLVCGRASMKVENTIVLIFDANFDAGGLRPHVKRPDDCKGILHDSTDEKSS